VDLELEMKSEATGRLLPLIDETTRAWFTAGEITIQSCDACGALQHPPSDVCGSCQGMQLGWRACSGEGRIESVAVVHHPVHPAFKDRVPYAVVVVSLDDAPGINAVGNVLGCDPSALTIGQKVSAVFEEITDPEDGSTLRIPQWELS
jgi:uncharacterized OB-fold protein